MTIYYGKCGCGWLKTDYPFMSCGKCGYIGCGTQEELDKARKDGTLIEWKKEKPENVEIRNCMLPDDNFLTDEGDFE